MRFKFSEDPRELIPELCRQFYHLGWVTGTGGGISLRQGDIVYMAPSGVQKERVQTEDIFVSNMRSGDVLYAPKGLKQSECGPLFMNAYRMRNAGAVIHSHSKHTVMATLLYPGKEFVVTHFEMIKGLRKDGTSTAYRYDERLVIPIIENTCFEKDLEQSMAEAMRQHPQTPAVLVRRHGAYIWGETWQRAKTQAECLDYLCEVAVQSKLAGIDPTIPPNE
ncbi:methylthioribulose-1-phosphate dehydratase-like isoform X2 [Varroa destructor]|uniref:Probable methylthioribulose-1-phosphate dehydratase n=1 Tax=Varroa destructor TaxID=109461 RepID=A0A7M7JR09_VARDE|nr:methylthioribulose-1-phosphate dehydratase-like isoform X2 [Varroa destructor]